MTVNVRFDIPVRSSHQFPDGPGGSKSGLGEKTSLLGGRGVSVGSSDDVDGHSHKAVTKDTVHTNRGTSSAWTSLKQRVAQLFNQFVNRVHSFISTTRPQATADWKSVVAEKKSFPELWKERDTLPGAKPALEHFMAHLDKEFATENLKFLVEVDKFNKERPGHQTGSVTIDRLQTLVAKYLTEPTGGAHISETADAPDAPTPVNLPSSKFIPFRNIGKATNGDLTRLLPALKTVEEEVVSLLSDNFRRFKEAAPQM